MNAPLPPQELLALIVDEAPQALLVLSPEGRVWSWSRAAQRLFGWNAEEAMGQPLEQLVGSVGDGHHLHDLHAEAARTGTARQVVLRRHKDGHLLHVEVVWRAVPAADGAVRCFVASKRDVTGEQHQRDVELVGGRYRDLLDSVPDAIVIVNDVGLIVLFNAEAARLFGVPAEAMLGQAVERLIPSRFARAHGAHREGFSAAPQRRPMGSGLELRGLRGDGQEFPVEVSLSPLSIGGRDFVMATLRDLTERLRLEEAQLAVHAAQRASSAKTEFLSRMSHELRTPLNAVLGFAQLLQIDPRHPLDATQDKHVDHIQRAGRHLLAMINDLLDITRIESGVLALSLEPVPLAALAEEVVAIVQPMAIDSGVRVLVSLEPVGLHVRADRVRLRQVLLNLLSNAIKYNKADGRVDVSARQSGGEVEIGVADTGAGLTPEKLARLFQPFDRLGAEAGPVEGTGIGLVIVRGLVQRMGGRIDVASEPGVGTVFTVALPAAEPPAGAAVDVGPVQAHGAVQDDATPRRRLLCVEDNEANVAVLRAAVGLRPLWEVEVARRGVEAMAIVRAERPDLMVVDMHLPDMSGIELMRRLDADPATAGIERVALSADATEGRVEAATRVGFARYFTKPLDLRAFLEWLDGVDKPRADAMG